MAATTISPPAAPAPHPPAPAPRPALVLAAALTTVTLWASAFVGIRAAGHDLSAGALTLARLLVGPRGARRPGPRPPRDAAATRRPAPPDRLRRAVVRHLQPRAQRGR